MTEHVTRCIAACGAAILIIASACGDGPTDLPPDSRDTFSGVYVLSRVDDRSAGSIVFRSTPAGAVYETRIVADTIEVLSDSTLRRATIFQTRLVRPGPDSLLPLEISHLCGTYTRAGTDIQTVMQHRECSSPPFLGSFIDSLWMSGHGVAVRGMKPSNPSSLTAEWWFAAR